MHGWIVSCQCVYRLRPVHPTTCSTTAPHAQPLHHTPNLVAGDLHAVATYTQLSPSLNCIAFMRFHVSTDLPVAVFIVGGPEVFWDLRKQRTCHQS